MVTAFLVSTALMGVLVVGVLWLARHRGWYEYTPGADSVALAPVRNGQVRQLSDDPRVLAVTFALLLVGALGGVVAYITGPTAQVGTLIALAGGGLLVAYLLVGIYVLATGRGHPQSMAVAESATVAGVLFLVAVTAQLLA